MDPQEKELIERVLAGDSAAFEPLVTPYRGALLGLALRIVPNPEDAREVAQEALFKAFRYLRRFDPALSFRNWLYQIAVNTARERRKRSGNDQRGLAAAVSEWNLRPAADDPVAGHEKAQARNRLRECLDVLSDREREVFWLREIEELSVEDTARVLKSSSISVRVHLNRARRKVLERFRSKFPELIGEPR
jgi:RNA polymerase sigma-70 factor (ECF subfamily)